MAQNNNQFNCPLCSGQLFFWEEYVYQESQNINNKTGLLEKRILKSKPEQVNTNGIECKKCGKTWSGSACDFKDSRIEKIFELINKS